MVLTVYEKLIVLNIVIKITYNFSPLLIGLTSPNPLIFNNKFLKFKIKQLNFN